MTRILRLDGNGLMAILKALMRIETKQYPDPDSLSAHDLRLILSHQTGFALSPPSGWRGDLAIGDDDGRFILMALAVYDRTGGFGCAEAFVAFLGAGLAVD